MHQYKPNKDYKSISEKLGLSVDLRLKTSRDSYATTLKRSGKSRDEIGEMTNGTSGYIKITPDMINDLINEVNSLVSYIIKSKQTEIKSWIPKN